MKATNAQVKLFFALVQEGNWNKNKAMAHAKKAFLLKHFTDITSAQISTLIDTMQKRIDDKRAVARQKEVINQLHVRMWDAESSRLLYSNIATVGQNQGVVMYFPMGEGNVSVDESQLDFNYPTTKFDIQNHLIYHYDIFKDADYPGTSWMTDWDETELQWVAYLMDSPKEVKEKLNNFKKPLIIGNAYKGVKTT